MIEYSKFEADTKNRVKDLAWMNGRFFIYAAYVFGAVGLGFILAGLIFTNQGWLGLGIQILALGIADVVVFITLYKRFQKAVTRNFDKYAVDGRIDYTIETTEEGKLLFTRQTDDDSFEIAWSDIRKMKYMKTIIVIVLRDKRTIDIPRSVDISVLMDASE